MYYDKPVAAHGHISHPKNRQFFGDPGILRTSRDERSEGLAWYIQLALLNKRFLRAFRVVEMTKMRGAYITESQILKRLSSPRVGG